MRTLRYTTLCGLAAAALVAAPASAATSVALLASNFQNDHAEYEPTTDAERARLNNILEIFKADLEKSGKFTFVDVKPEVKARIEAGPNMGDCGGCEVAFGKEIGAQQVAWVEVQKVSNLILNINVYMKDVAQDKMVFVKSVDIRGNTDETWNHAMRYLVKNYMVKPDA